MDMETFAQNVEKLRPKLYRTAFCYFGDETAALDVLDEAVYRGLCACKKLRQQEYFSTWMTRNIRRRTPDIPYYTTQIKR